MNDNNPLGENPTDEQVLFAALWRHLVDHQKNVDDAEATVRRALGRYNDTAGERPDVREVVDLMVALEFYMSFLDEMVIPIADGKWPPEVHEGESPDRAEPVGVEE